MNPTNQIDYPRQPTNEDIFDKLIKKITQLRMIVDKHKQAWKYFLYGCLMFICAILAYFSTTN